MAAYFEDLNLTGMANWMRLQADEEHEHSLKFYDFIIKISGRVTLGQIDKPKSSWKTPKEAFQEALAHEQFITKSINELTDLAISEKDHSTNTFLHWFIDEQVEEEAAAGDIVQKFNLIDESKSGLYMLDRELGQRVNSPIAE